MSQPFIVLVEAAIRPAARAEKPAKIQKSDVLPKAKAMNGKRRIKTPKGRAATAGKKLSASGWSECKKLFPAIEQAIDNPALDAFAPTKEWQTFLRKFGPSIIAAFFADTKVIAQGEVKAFFNYVQKQVKPAT